MKDTWFSISFIVFSSWPYYKEGFEVSSLTILWVGLSFHAHLLKIRSRQAMKLRKTLGRRKNWRTIQIQVRKKNRKNTVCSDNPTPLWSDYPTSALGLSDVEECASDYGSEHPSEKLFSKAPNFLHVRLIRRHQVDTSEQASDHSPESLFSGWDFLFRIGWSDAWFLDRRINEQ